MFRKSRKNLGGLEIHATFSLVQDWWKVKTGSKMMDCLTQRKEELFKDEGQDAKREIGKLSPTVSTE